MISQRDKTLTLIGILLALFLGALDQTIVSTALPKIVEDLQGVDRLAWVATAYLLASTVLVPIYGKLADMFSRKNIELWAISLFLLGSFLCGISGEFGDLPILGDGMQQLILFRALQGLGGAGLFSMAFIVIADLYPPNVRGKYQGFVGASFGIASVLGPWIGGLLTDYGGGIIPGIEGWRWVFYVNLPFGALALWFIANKMPKLKPADQSGSLDIPSALLLLVGLVPLILALQLNKEDYPWNGLITLSLFALSLVSLSLFIVRSLRLKSPILDLGLFKNKVFATSNMALFFLGASFLCIVIFLPFFMVNVLGVTATRAGVSLIPLSMGVVFGAVVSGQLVSRFGNYRLLMLIGGAILFFGMLLLANMSPQVSYWQVTLYMVVCGLGVGPSFPLYTLAIQNAVDVNKVGQATSASQFFRQIGGAMGAAIMGTVLATSLASSFATLDLPGQQAEIFGIENDLTATGGANIEAQVQAAFAKQYDAIAEAIRRGDLESLNRLLATSPLPKPAQASILKTANLAQDSPEATSLFLSQVKEQLDMQANILIQDLQQSIKNAFSQGITQIFVYLVFLVALAWLVTLFVPELALRKTNDRTSVEG